MLVKDLMTRDVSSCSPGNNLAEIAEMMWNQRCGALPIVDGSKRVVGMITDRDVCIALGTRNMKASDVLVRDVSPLGCFTCQPGADVRNALRTMVTEEVGRLPVIDGAGQLIGILSIDDIVFRAGGGCSNLSDSEIINSMRALWEDRIHRPSGTTHEESESHSNLRMPINFPRLTSPMNAGDPVGLCWAASSIEAHRPPEQVRCARVPQKQ